MSWALPEDTLVMFSSDNGPHNEANHDLLRFNPSGPLRGTKRALYDGGIRVPFLAWWPGTIQPGRVSQHIGYFGDLMATSAELAGADLPQDTDSVSFVPTLTGRAGGTAEARVLVLGVLRGRLGSSREDGPLEGRAPADVDRESRTVRRDC